MDTVKYLQYLRTRIWVYGTEHERFDCTFSRDNKSFRYYWTNQLGIQPIPI